MNKDGGVLQGGGIDGPGIGGGFRVAVGMESLAVMSFVVELGGGRKGGGVEERFGGVGFLLTLEWGELDAATLGSGDVGLPTQEPFRRWTER